MVIALSRQHPIAYRSAQSFSRLQGFDEVVRLCHQQLTQGLGAGQEDTLEICDNVVTNQAVIRKSFDPIF